jgi:hypothetical protein
VERDDGVQWRWLFIAVGCGALIIWAAGQVESGLTQEWGELPRRLLTSGAMFLLFVAIGGVLQFGFSLFDSAPPIAHYLVILGAGVCGFMLVADWVDDTTGFDADRSVFIGLGVFSLACTWVRPWWYWEHPKALWLRDLIGDVATQVVYTLFALGFIAYGVLVPHPAI